MTIPYTSQSSRSNRMPHLAAGKVAGMERGEGTVIVFTKGEKIALWALAAAFIAPVTTWDGKLFLATEIAMMVFVAAAHWRVNRLARVVPLLVVLAVPLAFAFPFPSRGFSLPIAGLVYVKLAVFAYFVYILVERCRNTANVGWLAKNVILPVALVLCLSALVDRYTESPFFVEWHRRVTSSSMSGLAHFIQRYGADPELMDRIYGVSPKAGFATRPSDIPPWALLGLAAAYWLRQSSRMKTSTFLGIILVLMATSFSMPKRSAVITIGVAVLAFLLLARTRADKRWKVALFILTAGIAVASNWVTVRYIVVNLAIDPTAASAMVSTSRLLSYRITQDMRYEMLPLEIEWLLNNPRELLLGTGWNLTGGLWVKPHNTYIALITGGGLFSLPAVVIAVARLFRRRVAERGQGRPGIMGTVLLVALCVEIGINGYLFYRLEFPASTLAVWLAWSAIMYQNPPVDEEGPAKDPLQSGVHLC